MTTQSLELGKSYRLYIATIAVPATDSDYTAVVNENNMQVSWNGDAQQIDTKEAGKVSFPGSESTEIAFDYNLAFSSTAIALLDAARNVPTPYQIRKVAATGGGVFLEGTFLLSDVKETMATASVVSGNGTLKNTNTVTMHRTPRTLTP